MDKIKYMLECEMGKAAVLRRAIDALEQAAKDEQVFTMLEDYSPYYTYAIGKLTRAYNLAWAKAEILQEQLALVDASTA